MTGGLLLDVNVLVALVWPTHIAHRTVQQWFGRQRGESWATCPATQSGFARILANPAFSPNALSPQEALGLLQEIVQHPEHRFWRADIALADAVQPFIGKIHGHKQISDAYLLGLALNRRGRLVTLDRGILALLPERSVERQRVVVIE